VHSSWATPTGVLQLDVAASQLAKSSKPIPWFFDGMWGAAIHLDFHMFSQLALISRRPGHLLRQQLDDTG